MKQVSDYFLSFKKDFYKDGASGQNFSFNVFFQISNWTYNKSNPYIPFQNFDLGTCSSLNLYERF